MVLQDNPPTNTRKDKIKSNYKTNPCYRMLQLEMLKEDLVVVLLLLLMIFFWYLQEAFWYWWGDDIWFRFSLALLGFLMGLGFRFKNNPLFFFLFFSFLFSLFLFLVPMELLVLLNLIFNYLTVMTWNVAVWDFLIWKQAQKLAVMCLCALFELAQTSSSWLG